MTRCGTEEQLQPTEVLGFVCFGLVSVTEGEKVGEGGDVCILTGLPTV